MTADATSPITITIQTPATVSQDTNVQDSSTQSRTTSSASEALSNVSNTVSNAGNTVSTMSRRFYDELPSDVLQNTAISFVASFALGTVISGQVSYGLVTGTMGAFAALIYAVTAPLMRMISRKMGHNEGQAVWWLELIRRIVVLTVAVAVTSVATVYSVHILATVVLSATLYFITNHTRSHDLNRSASYIFF